MVLVIPATAPIREGALGLDALGTVVLDPPINSNDVEHEPPHVPDGILGHAVVRRVAGLGGNRGTETADPDRAARRQRCIEHRRSG